MPSIHRSAARSVAAAGLACVVAASAPGAAHAADLPVATRIAAVTLYPSGATITRRGELALPAGAHRLVVTGLPAGLDPAALRVGVDAPGVRLAGVEAVEIARADAADARERELRAKLDALNDRRAAIADEVATAETQLKVLESLSAPGPAAGARPPADGAALASLVAAVGTTAGGARARIRDANQRLRALDAEKAALEATLAKVASDRRASTELRVAVDADAAATVPVRIEYRAQDAGWQWLYEARLDTRTRRLRLARQAAVRQASGEDWTGVELRLSTSRASGATVTPDVEPLYATLLDPTVREQRYASPSARGIVGSPAPSFDAVVVTAARVEATAYAVEYRVPGAASVAADREPRIYPIATDDFEVELLARAVPAVERAAFLEARFEFAREVPFPPAPLQLYRDGAFVGSATAPRFQPGERVRLGFGADERIRVEVLRDAEASGDRGLLARRGVQQRRERFQVTSFHSEPIPFELVDRVPVARAGDVEVRVDRDSTPPTERDVDGRPGVLAWRLLLQPRQPATVRHSWTVEYPKDRELVFE